MPIRTDLAIESREMFAEEITGVETAAHDSDGITITHVNIKTKDGANFCFVPCFLWSFVL